MKKLAKILKKFEEYKYICMFGTKPTFIFWPGDSGGLTEAQICLGQGADYVDLMKVARDLVHLQGLLVELTDYIKGETK